ncbi:MAG: adenosylcobinamide-GDP ribazoletransferase [Alphaproteobacteria bacterium]
MQNAGTNLDILTAWIRDARTAAVFLTRIPVPMSEDAEARPLAAVAWAFPIVGIAVGGIAGVTLMAASSLGLYPLICGLLALAMGIIATGALHEDALADVADGFGGGADAESKMEIMRDSRIGAYGVLALVFSVAIRAAALASMTGPGTAALALIAAATVSRGLMAAALYQLPAARGDGLGAAAGKPTIESTTVALAIAAVAAFVLLGAAGWIVLAVAGVAAVCVGWLAMRQIGGHTGDVLGSICQVSEIAVLVAVSALLG